MEFKVTGTVEAKSAKEALHMVPEGCWITEPEAHISDVKLFKGGVEVTDLSPADKETARRLSNGINIEGFARQRDVEKLAKWMEDVEKAVNRKATLTKDAVTVTDFESSPSQEDFDKLAKRVEELELIIGAQLDETIPYGIAYATRFGDIRISGSELISRYGKDGYEYERAARTGYAEGRADWSIE